MRLVEFISRLVEFICRLVDISNMCSAMSWSNHYVGWSQHLEELARLVDGCSQVGHQWAGSSPAKGGRPGSLRACDHAHVHDGQRLVVFVLRATCRRVTHGRQRTSHPRCWCKRHPALTLDAALRPIAWLSARAPVMSHQRQMPCLLPMHAPTPFPECLLTHNAHII